MQVQQHGDWLKAARITSLNDRYLGLRFGQEPLDDQRPVAAAVQEGVSQANADFGTHYHVSEIQVADGDRFHHRAYADMAYLMVEYAVEQGLVFRAPERKAA